MKLNKNKRPSPAHDIYKANKLLGYSADTFKKN